MDTQPQFEPALHLKAESASAYEFSLDMDHRRRRRNRTTQSCLNCHTSKRKVRPRAPPPLPVPHSVIQCDRKRPCQRCIQLGLVITVPPSSPSRLAILTSPPPDWSLCLRDRRPQY